MTETRYLDDDIVRIHEFGKPRSAKSLLATLFWGDNVRVIGREDGVWKLDFARREWNVEKRRYETKKYVGFLPAKARFREESLLKVRFVDVGQGDAAVVESPQGRLVLIDGGEDSSLRRYVQVAWSHVLRSKPLHCDAIVVTHGDADHFSGLTELALASRSQTSPLITVERVFHNGLVKSSAERDVQAFGKTAKLGGSTYAVELEQDLREVPDARMNTPFLAWKRALARLAPPEGTLAIRRLEYGDASAFDFLRPEGIEVKVLGPIVEDVRGKPGLAFLHPPGSRSLSASHTINGHSIVLKLAFGHVRFLFGADLNAQSEERLLERTRLDNESLTAEVLKVPHHGSEDFSPRALEAIRPVVSVVSSGDESVAKEYIHPRAGLMGALGKYSRAGVDKPLVYATEMVAFFERLGLVRASRITPSGKPGKDLGEIQNAYRKIAFGIVHVRTDGRRVLVVTHSGRDDRKESYAFQVDERGEVTFEDKPRIL